MDCQFRLERPVITFHERSPTQSALARMKSKNRFPSRTSDTPTARLHLFLWTMDRVTEAASVSFGTEVKHLTRHTFVLVAR